MPPAVNPPQQQYNLQQAGAPGNRPRPTSSALIGGISQTVGRVTGNLELVIGSVGGTLVAWTKVQMQIIFFLF